MGCHGPLHGLDRAAGDNTGVVVTCNARVNGSKSKRVPALHGARGDAAAAVGQWCADRGVTTHGSIHRGYGSHTGARALPRQAVSERHFRGRGGCWGWCRRGGLDWSGTAVGRRVEGSSGLVSAEDRALTVG